MNTWFRSAIFAGAALAVLGLASQAFPATSQVLVVDDTSCNKLFPNTPGIDELLLGRGELVGVHVRGELTVEVKATSFVKNKPSEFDWVSQSANGSPARVNAVIVSDSRSVSNLFPYPPGASFDSGLTGVKGQEIDRVRFCFGGPPVATAAFAPSPLTQDLLEKPCNALGDGVIILPDPANPGSPPAIAPCGVTAQACLNLPGAPQPCFGTTEFITQSRGFRIVNLEDITGGTDMCTIIYFSGGATENGRRICFPHFP